MRTDLLFSVLLLAAALLLAAMLMVGGCALSGGATTTTAAPTTTTAAPSTTTTEAETTTTTAAKLAFGAKGTWEGISVTATRPEIDYSPTLVGEGNKVVYCTVTIVNNSSEPFDYNGLEFTLFDADHQEYDNAGLASVADLGVGTLAPGESADGAVAFEMPIIAAPTGLEWQPSSSPAPTLIWGDL
jgi:hypothetical protein